jgi:hypothetical protein
VIKSSEETLNVADEKLAMLKGGKEQADSGAATVGTTMGRAQIG